MGWVNYIVVPSKKLAFEISRHIKDLEDDEKKTLDTIISSEEFENESIDMGARRLKKGTDGKLNLSLNLRQLKNLMNTYDQVQILKSMSIDKLLMYWLERSKVPYEVMSEFTFNEKGYREQGYNIICEEKDEVISNARRDD